MTGVCFHCVYRAESIKAVEDWRARNSVGVGIVNDTAPKAECKLHEGYGRPNETKIECREFKDVQSTSK